MDWAFVALCGLAAMLAAFGFFAAWLLGARPANDSGESKPAK